MEKKTSMIALYVLVFCCAAAVFAAPAIDKVRQLYVMGQLEKAKQEAIQNGEDYVIAKGKNIEVYNGEVQNILDEYDEKNISKARLVVIESIATKEALRAEAVRLEYPITDEEVQQFIEEQIAFAPTASNYEFIEQFLEEKQMTLEEYWQSQYEFMKRELHYVKLLEDKREEWQQEPNYIAMELDSERYQYIEDKTKEYKQHLLDRQNLVILEE